MNDLETLVERLPAGMLPAGRFVVPEDDDDGDGDPVYWLSDGPCEAGVWARLRALHPGSGLWPVLLHGMEREPDRPWVDGEVYPEGGPEGAADAASLLAGWWDQHVGIDSEEDADSLAERGALTEPFGPSWPGMAAGGASALAAGAAEAVADRFAEQSRCEHTRLGLVAVQRGADALWMTGWCGAVNYVGSAELAVVVRSWEDRFGARVVRIGFATLELSVAAPPLTEADALAVAAEHFAACPDNIWQSTTDTVRAYARTLVGSTCWTFWWD